MIKIFTGEDRVKLLATAKTELGPDYESYEGEKIGRDELRELLFGLNLFNSGKTRRILVKDLSENKESFEEFCEKIEEFVKTEEQIILAESRIDKRLAGIKKLVKAGVEIKEFKLAEPANARVVFGIYDWALKDGVRAIEELKKIENTQDPYQFLGLLVSQALKRLELRPMGKLERRAIWELAEIDIQMKSSTLEPWLLIKSFLLRVGRRES